MATPEGRGPRFEEVSRLCENLFCPVTVGGGVRNVNDIGRLLRSGADKVSINTVALEHPSMVESAAQRFGAQAVCVSIDVRGGTVWHTCGRVDTGLDPVSVAKEMEARGAGELLVTSIENDGMLGGFDLGSIRSISGAVDIPVVAAGGCGSYKDVECALDAGAHAVAVGAAFQFTEMTPKGAARHLHEQGFAVRL